MFNAEFDSQGHLSLLYKVILTAGDGGTVTGGGSYKYGTVITITATASSGYKFTQWSDGNTDNPRQITVNSDISLSCEFVEKVMETWYFNEIIPKPSSDVIYNCTFSSNSIHYNSMKWYLFNTGGPFGKVSAIQFIALSINRVYDGEIGWFSQSYRTIVLDEPATGDLLTFLQANATKIS